MNIVPEKQFQGRCSLSCYGPDTDSRDPPGASNKVRWVEQGGHGIGPLAVGRAGLEGEEGTTGLLEIRTPDGWKVSCVKNVMAFAFIIYFMLDQ